ncbi:rhomboid family intramembrane serine protease [Pseudoalteromonas luteoviolacea]|nr:rhomboid family intramembrane serine protease [Pseudoalteromonas luteoviolacea]
MLMSRILFPKDFRYIIGASLIMIGCMLLGFIGVPIERLGIVALEEDYLIGIVTAPFVHGSWSHLSGNLIGLWICGYIASRQPKFKRVSVAIVIMTGALVWLFAGDGNHIGSSGVVMGYYGYLSGVAVFQRHLTGIISLIALAILTYLANINLFGTLFNFSENISTESHLFGFLSGLLLAYAIRS